jgi:hypothetical protein
VIVATDFDDALKKYREVRPDAKVQNMQHIGKVLA